MTRWHSLRGAGALAATCALRSRRECIKVAMLMFLHLVRAQMGRTLGNRFGCSCLQRTPNFARYICEHCSPTRPEKFTTGFAIAFVRESPARRHTTVKRNAGNASSRPKPLFRATLAARSGSHRDGRYRSFQGGGSAALSFSSAVHFSGAELTNTCQQIGVRKLRLRFAVGRIVAWGA